MEDFDIVLISTIVALIFGIIPIIYSFFEKKMRTTMIFKCIILPLTLFDAIIIFVLIGLAKYNNWDSDLLQIHNHVEAQKNSTTDRNVNDNIFINEENKNNTDNTDNSAYVIANEINNSGSVIMNKIEVYGSGNVIIDTNQSITQNEQSSDESSKLENVTLSDEISNKNEIYYGMYKVDENNEYILWTNNMFIQNQEPMLYSIEDGITTLSDWHMYKFTEIFLYDRINIKKFYATGRYLYYRYDSNFISLYEIYSNNKMDTETYWINGDYIQKPALRELHGISDYGIITLFGQQYDAKISSYYKRQSDYDNPEVINEKDYPQVHSTYTELYFSDYQWLLDPEFQEAGDYCISLYRINENRTKGLSAFINENQVDDLSIESVFLYGQLNEDGDIVSYSGKIFAISPSTIELYKDNHTWKNLNPNDNDELFNDIGEFTFFINKSQ